MVSTGESVLISCGDMHVYSPLELEKQCQSFCRVDIGIGGFLSRCQGLSHLPSCFELVFEVTVESVLGSQVCLECPGHRGSFEMVARPLEFLLSVKWRLPHLEVRRECRDSLPDEEGKWPLLSR